ncbi:putative quinol monooxygenase [Xenorhabdus innexi]|uniref:Antibiotic biosynthesis monooxygenase n=1 Tax=Xenorhabdus innexi TaxID=290109 RepID=A0A1N6MTP4_9GAMM|nr:antibiotic biosynthesis monooxygenase [Xenorhabdus innexi]PHM27979.1 hypothetical protein Xinn_03893 [Xenorhabdus innexi]SIP72245.1 Antibiotic biosynthesis monooxygenase [Xenorhabdus innexi]
MIKLTGHLVCRSAEESEVIRKYIPEHKRLTKEETGCLSFEVTETADPLIWKVEEIFKNKDDLDSHQKRMQASVWGKKTHYIAREYEIFEIE